MFLLHCQSPAGFVQQSTKHRFNYSVWYTDLIPPVSIITKTNCLKGRHAKLTLLQSQSSQFKPRRKPWEQRWKQHDVEALSSLKNNISHRAKVSCQRKVQTSVLLPHVSSQEIGSLAHIYTQGTDWARDGFQDRCHTSGSGSRQKVVSSLTGTVNPCV